MLRKVNLVCVGGLKRNYLKQLEKKYLSNINLIVVKDSNLELESKNILNIINKYCNIVCVLFDLEGRYDKNIHNEIIYKFNQGCILIFIVGGSDGVSNELKKRCHFLLKISDFTYSHQIFRIGSILFIREILSDL